MAKYEVKMPKLGESITEGTIMSWAVKVGDVIKEDEILFEVNTAKVSAEIPSPVAGKVLEILFGQGDTVSVGTVVAVVDIDGQEDSFEAPGGKSEDKEDSKAVVEQQPAKTVEASTVPVPDKQVKGESERWYSPAVLEIAREAKISSDELDAIPGTGYLGRVSKRDMEQYIERKGKGTVVQPVPQASVSVPHVAHTIAPVSTGTGQEIIPMDPVRRIIADRMVESKKISAHVTSVIEADVTGLVRWREQNKDEFKKREGISLTYMPAIARAVANALREFPRINSSVDGYNIIEKKDINIGIAVSLDDGNLIVPVIKNADRLNTTGLAGAIASAASKARKNALTTGDIEGGTFTITNFGSFKSLFGTPIINQPEVAILGVGVIEKKPAVMETPEGDVIAIRHKMYLSLSYDHRVVDGALGGKFLYSVARYLEEWKG